MLGVKELSRRRQYNMRLKSPEKRIKNLFFSNLASEHLADFNLTVKGTNGILAKRHLLFPFS